MEKKYVMLFEFDYKKRSNVLMKCVEVVLDNNFIIFFFENGGQCFFGKDVDKIFMKYGVSYICKGDINKILYYCDDYLDISQIVDIVYIEIMVKWLFFLNG